MSFNVKNIMEGRHVIYIMLSHAKGPSDKKMGHNQILCFFLVIVVALTPSFGATDQEEAKVTLSLYYETLCPYCANFIVNNLVKVFDEGLISILNLRLIPWGNAWRNPNGTVVCQHGTDECFLNAIEACAITINPDVERHFSVIHCIERLILEDKSGEWSSCFQTTGVPIDCYNTGYGDVLVDKYGDETVKLNPPHRFVPWVVVNNEPLEEDFGNFIAYVCKAYRGDRVPDACRSLPLNSNQYELKADSGDRVCYAGKGPYSSFAEEDKKKQMQP